MGFADFETKLKSINKKGKIEDALNQTKSFTIRKSAHKIVSFSLILLTQMENRYLKKTLAGHFF